MRAVIIEEHGALDALTYVEDFETPTAGEGEVIVKVGATALNYHDIFTRRGMPGIKIPMPIIMGIDVAGEISEVGAGVEGWSVGDRVLIDPANRVEGGLTGETTHGGLAEFCRAKAHQLVALPENISFEQAAALPVAYGTAIRMMRTIGKIQPGEKVLILGASGGVGICCVQLAKLAGAHVIAAAGTAEKAEKLTAVGADEIVLYREENFEKVIKERHGKARMMGGGGGIDVVVNFTGGDTWVPSLKVLKKGGRVLTCGATAGYDPKEDLRFIWTFELQILGSNGWEREDLMDLIDLVASGDLKAVVDHAYPLTEAYEAMRVLEDREVTGKVVVKP
ncbi:MAG: zinc-binding dehydrogenase [Pseudomonadota bacterium]|nr:zinc-binding dehydrogenase [Pseudomonadota bacterium]